MKKENKLKTLSRADGNKLTIGVDVNIPKSTWLYLGLAIAIPGVIFLVLNTIKQAITK